MIHTGKIAETVEGLDGLDLDGTLDDDDTFGDRIKITFAIFASIEPPHNGELPEELVEEMYRRAAEVGLTAFDHTSEQSDHLFRRQGKEFVRYAVDIEAAGDFYNERFDFSAAMLDDGSHRTKAHFAMIF